MHSRRSCLSHHQIISSPNLFDSLKKLIHFASPKCYFVTYLLIYLLTYLLTYVLTYLLTYLLTPSIVQVIL